MQISTISVCKVEFELRHFLDQLGTPMRAGRAIQDFSKSLVDFVAIRFLENEPCPILKNFAVRNVIFERIIFHGKVVLSIRESRQSCINLADKLLILF